jgi:signal transduction histidine kinase
MYGRPSDPAVDAAADVDARLALRRARARAALPYLQRWRPLVVTLVFVGTILTSVAAPHDARPGVIVAVSAMFVATWGAAALTHAGMRPRRIAFAITLLDIPLITAWAIETRSSTGEGLSALVGTALVAAWLFGPRPAALIGTLTIVATLGTWFVGGPWAEPQVLPDVTWVLMAGTVLAVALASEVEHALLESTRSLRGAITKMRELDRMRRRLVADVSHELRTPLTAINGFLDTVLRDDLEFDPATSRELIAEARRGGARLELLVSDLLDIERASGGTLPLVLEERSLGELVERAVRAVPTPTGRDVRVDLREGAATAVALVDERRFFQVVANLVDNALHHGVGTVRVRCHAVGGELCVDVLDDGPGLPRGSERHVFEPFTSFGSNAGSAGLGLSIARAFVQAHGGSLEYVPEADDGAHAFRISLPRTVLPPSLEA